MVGSAKTGSQQKQYLSTRLPTERGGHKIDGGLGRIHEQPVEREWDSDDGLTFWTGNPVRLPRVFHPPPLLAAGTNPVFFFGETWPSCLLFRHVSRDLIVYLFYMTFHFLRYVADISCTHAVHARIRTGLLSFFMLLLSPPFFANREPPVALLETDVIQVCTRSVSCVNSDIKTRTRGRTATLPCMLGHEGHMGRHRTNGPWLGHHCFDADYIVHRTGSLAATFGDHELQASLGPRQGGEGRDRGHEMAGWVALLCSGPD